MAVQPTPPIQLDPSMDEGHKLAFINQNFQSIANTLQQNSFVIAQSGTVTLIATANQGSFNTVTHNLGFVPMVIATCQSPNFVGTNAAMVPYISFPDTTSKVVATIANVRSDLIQFGVELGSAATGSAGTWTFKYFLLQQTANS